MTNKVTLIIAGFILSGVILLIVTGITVWYQPDEYQKPLWTTEEKKLIASLWLGNLSKPPANPGNAVSESLAAAVLGHQLFFDARLSSNGKVACASCHKPESYFTDQRPVATAIGTSQRNTPTVVGSAWSPFLFWDGRVDSLWAQALEPLENVVEHGSSRLQIAHLIDDDADYHRQYESLFGSLPALSDHDRFPPKAGPVDEKVLPAVARAWREMNATDQQLINRIYSNLGKAIAAYERLLLPTASRFDHYARSIRNDSDTSSDESSPNGQLDEQEVAGLRLFIGEARCIECHNGPLFSNHGFHNTAVPERSGSPAKGRTTGVDQLIDNPFNCLGKYSDARPEDCVELRFVKKQGDDLLGSFKVPSLRNVSKTPPYMHAGQFANLDDVLAHYNEPPEPAIGHSMLQPLMLSSEQLLQIKHFLRSLDSPIAIEDRWLRAPEAER